MVTLPWSTVFDNGIYDFIHHHPRDDQDIVEPNTKPDPRPEPELTPIVTRVKDLKQLAEKHGVKYDTRMGAKELCEVLGVEITKPFKYIFTNTKTGKENKFTSIYQASKEMNVNPGLMSYYLETDITIGEHTYSLREI